MATISPSDHEWLLRARTRNQRALLDLLTYGAADRKALVQREADRATFLFLVGVAFSLWRAAFLSAEARPWEEIVDDAICFLDTLVHDNAIGYYQDRATKDWSGGYYLNSARYRLLKALEVVERESPGIRQHPAVLAFESLDRTGMTLNPPRHSWDVLHEALAALVEDLTARAPNTPSHRAMPLP
jgi:hypothetical protein